MRCPKCHYLGFEPEPRCKHCGYDFSLSEPDATPDRAPLTLSMEGLDDITLGRSEPPVRMSSAMDLDFDLRDLDLITPPAVASAPVTQSADLDFHSLDASSRSQSESDMPLHPPADSAFRLAEVEPELIVAVRSAPVAVSVEPVRRPVPRPGAGRPAPMTMDLPLFMQGLPDAGTARAGAAALDDDVPLVAMSAPRAPLSVRRATPEPARLRATYAKAEPARAQAPVSMNLLESADVRITSEAAGGGLNQAERPTPPDTDVSPGQRLVAASVDTLLLGSLNAAVVWFTLDVCRLSLGEIPALPWLPMLAFLLLLDVGYLVVFTAACGQTLGKMAAGIRVVATSAESISPNGVSFARATGRAIGVVLSTVPLGFGFWFAMSGQGLTLHDRMAHTRVVRA